MISVQHCFFIYQRRGNRLVAEGYVKGFAGGRCGRYLQRTVLGSPVAGIKGARYHQISIGGGNEKALDAEGVSAGKGKAVDALLVLETGRCGVDGTLIHVGDGDGSLCIGVGVLNGAFAREGAGLSGVVPVFAREQESEFVILVQAGNADVSGKIGRCGLVAGLGGDIEISKQGSGFENLHFLRAAPIGVQIVAVGQEQGFGLGITLEGLDGQGADAIAGGENGGLLFHTLAGCQ